MLINLRLILVDPNLQMVETPGMASLIPGPAETEGSSHGNHGQTRIINTFSG